MMNRRHFLRTFGSGLLVSALPNLSYALAGPDYGRLLILIELKGGNDGLNTVIPYNSPDYYRLRPQLNIPRDQVIHLSEQTGLHPSLKGLMPLWDSHQLAIVQGVGYPAPNFSHFRSIEIWDTASASNQFLPEGWLSRLFHHSPPPRNYAADGIVLASQTLGPLDGGARAVVLTTPQEFARQAKLANDTTVTTKSAALGHILKVEDDIRQAAAQLTPAMTRAKMSDSPMAPPRPAGSFQQAILTLSQTLAQGTRIAVARLSLNGFDTHYNQKPTQARLLADLADGLTLLKTQLHAQGKWDDTLVISYAEFGRRPRENGNQGTDHGTVNAHFVTGGRVKGGLYGQMPNLAGLTDGNLNYAVDFRQLYSMAIRQWWGKDSSAVLGGNFEPLPILAV